MLDTCKELGADCTDKQAMIDALFETKGRESVLGTYDIDENGDTTLTDYGIYTIEGGELEFEQDDSGRRLSPRAEHDRLQQRGRAFRSAPCLW